MKNNKSLHEDFELLTLLKGNFFFLELKFLLLYLFIYLFIYFYPGFSFITF